MLKKTSFIALLLCFPFILYAQDNIDLTKQVIERFNKKGGR